MTDNNELYLNSRFWFTNNVGLSLPYVSLAYTGGYRCIFCGETMLRRNDCRYCFRTSDMSARKYLRLKRIRRHRNKYEPVMLRIRRFNQSDLLKNKYNKVMYQLQLSPPLNSTLAGGIIYQEAKNSYESNIKNI